MTVSIRQRQSSNLQQNVAWKPKMIVFDKDGTVGDCTYALVTWVQRMSVHIAEHCSTDPNLRVHTNKILQAFYSAIGWSSENKEFVPSALLAAGTWEQVLDASAAALQRYISSQVNVAAAFETSIATTIKDHLCSWHKNLGDIHANDVPLINDLPGFMSYFRQNGCLTAICTSDDRRATDACLRNWGLTNLIDFSICGDEVREAKPSAHPLHELCKMANVNPSDCIVVGDTSADMGMGRNARAGLTVGVLTGTGSANQLYECGANVILPNIGFLVGFTSMFSSMSTSTPAIGMNTTATLKQRTVSFAEFSTPL